MAPEHRRIQADLVQLYRSEPALKNAAERMARCCRNALVRAGSTAGDVVIAPMRCDDRLCPACHGHRTRGARSALERMIVRRDRGERGRIRFLTLTMGRPDEPRSALDAYKDASAALLKFSRTKAWKRRVRGAFGGYESTWGAKGWHPHWHILFEGSYWPVKCSQARPCAPGRDRCIRCAWSSSGGGRIVDVREADEETIGEVTKYPIKCTSIPDEHVVEWRMAMVRRRTHRTWGTWYAIGRDEPETTDREVFRWVELREAATGDPWACTRIVKRMAPIWDDALPVSISAWAAEAMAAVEKQLRSGPAARRAIRRAKRAKRRARRRPREALEPPKTGQEDWFEAGAGVDSFEALKFTAGFVHQVDQAPAAAAHFP